MEYEDLNLDLAALINKKREEMEQEERRRQKKEIKAMEETEFRKGVKADLDRIRNSSITDEILLIKGELYKGKSINKTLIKRVGAICAAALAAYLSVKGVEYKMVTDTYDYILDDKVADELDHDQTKEFLKQEPKSNKEKYDNYQESLSELEKNAYDIGGHRKDEVKSKYFSFDEDSLFNLSEKQIDAIDNATTNDINEFKGSNK